MGTAVKNVLKPAVDKDFIFSYNITVYAPVAQLDRASAS